MCVCVNCVCVCCVDCAYNLTTDGGKAGDLPAGRGGEVDFI